MNHSQSLLAFGLSLAPAILWLSFYYHKDKKDPEPKGIVLQTFLAGAFMALPFLVLRSAMGQLMESSSLFATLATGFSAVFLFALLEEVAKIGACIFVIHFHKKNFNQVIDGIFYAITAALGFAFVENKVYFYEFLSGSGEGLLSVFMFRSLGTMLAHTIFSGLAGLIWAYAEFSKKITPFNKHHLFAFKLKDFFNREILSLHIIRQNILKARPSRRGGHEKKVLLLEGIVLATILHAIFNLTTSFNLLGQNLTFLLVPVMMLGMLYTSYLFTKKQNMKIYKVV